MKHGKVKYSLCIAQQVWLGLHCKLQQQGWAGGLWGWRLSGLWRYPEEEAALGKRSAQSPANM